MNYDRFYNWMNIAIIFMNAAMDKQVLQQMITSLVFSILSAIP